MQQLHVRRWVRHCISSCFGWLPRGPSRAIRRRTHEGTPIARSSVLRRRAEPHLGYRPLLHRLEELVYPGETLSALGFSAAMAGIGLAQHAADNLASTNLPTVQQGRVASAVNTASAGGMPTVGPRWYVTPTSSNKANHDNQWQG